MRIVINHLTRMDIGYCCVAGIQRGTNTHVRPVLNKQRLGVNLLLRHNSLFDIATEVELGSVKFNGSAPEVEDWVFDPSSSQVVSEVIPSRDFWDLLQSCTHQHLRSIFGAEIEKQGRTAATPKGQGHGSLGCFQSVTKPYLDVKQYNGKEKLELSIQDPELGQLIVAVTDLRFYQHSDHKLRMEVVERYAKEMRNGTSVILSMGLARPYRKPGDITERHWLQVNNIVLESMPTQQDRTLP
jgi:hypothetical protein